MLGPRKLARKLESISDEEEEQEVLEEQSYVAVLGAGAQGIGGEMMSIISGNSCTSLLRDSCFQGGVGDNQLWLAVWLVGVRQLEDCSLPPPPFIFIM